MIGLAALALGFAVTLLLTPRTGIQHAQARVAPGLGAFAATVLGLPVGLVLVPRPTVVAIVLAAAGLGLLTLWRRRRRRLEAAAVSARVLETCELLASELAAGRPPGAALDRAALDWPALAAVARASRLGSDVPQALRTASGLEGAGDLRLLAAAWQVSQRSGQGLGVAVGAIAGDLRALQATRRVVESELASARATARLVAALPIPVLAMGGTAGADPWAFLLGTPVGIGCLGAGLACALGGLWWIDAIASSPDLAT